ncbi:putative membrane protein [Corynebacterium deserti GIMN1.010]|uniref:Putative membrane protein n=1 Tax=Corynebacterium deserti GIMN1.010 TaxID=931089 RepID=A0A0M4CWA2_9CORY|nr:putative membrane protein [Corynebacterium deserti GIMN1.010]
MQKQNLVVHVHDMIYAWTLLTQMVLGTLRAILNSLIIYVPFVLKTLVTEIPYGAGA